MREADPEPRQDPVRAHFPGRRSRLPDVLVYAFGRPLMLVFWALTIWGTVAAGAIGARVIGGGWAAAVGERGESVLAAPANFALAGFAVFVWTIVGLALWRRRAERGDLPEEGR